MNFNMDNILNNITKNISYFSIQANYLFTFQFYFFFRREQKIIPKEDYF